MGPLLLLLLQAGAYQSGMQAYNEHRYADSIPYFEKAAGSGPQALVASFMLGNASLQAHQEDKALRAFAALYEVRADSAAAHLLTAAMMLRAQMPEAAEKEAHRALEIDARMPQAHYVLGEAALANGQAEQAIDELRKELALNPNFPMAYFRLGDAYLKHGGSDDAIASLQRSIWLNPNHSGPYVLIGKAYLKRGERDEAEAALKHALELDPQNQEAQRLLNSEGTSKPSAMPYEPAYLRGRREYLAGHHEEAIEWLEKARGTGVRTNELFFMLGNSYLQHREIAKGRSAFAELFAVPPNSGASRTFSAQFLMRLELEDAAETELKAAAEQEAKLPGTHYMLGEVAIYRAQFERAVEELNREIGLNPAFAMAYYRLGDAYTRREDWEHAIPPLQRSIWLNPTYSGPYILLGKAYFKMNDLADAERMLRLALQMDPRNASAHYLLGRTLMQAGKTEEGKKLLRRWEELRTDTAQ